MSRVIQATLPTVLLLLLAMALAPHAKAQGGGDKSNTTDPDELIASSRAWVCRDDAGTITEARAEPVERARLRADAARFKAIGDGTVTGILDAAIARLLALNAAEAERVRAAIAFVRANAREKRNLRLRGEMSRLASQCRFETLAAWRVDRERLLVRKELARAFENSPIDIAAMVLHESIRFELDRAKVGHLVSRDAITDQVERVLYGHDLYFVLPPADLTEAGANAKE